MNGFDLKFIIFIMLFTVVTMYKKINKLGEFFFYGF